VNQWQLIAALQARRPPFTRSAEALLAAMRAFELTAARYDEHQRAMETYWSLRWLLQEKVHEFEAAVLRENLVRFDGLPLVQRVPSLPESVAPGSRVRLALRGVDLIERTADCVYQETVSDGRALDETAAEPDEKA
jgi:exoribonuclease-2